MMHYLLMYDVGPDYVERRGMYRDAHLGLARAAHARGELVLGGALADPIDGAVLLFRGESPAVAEAFALADPYVRSGLVTRWRVRPWTTVVGDNPAVVLPAEAGAVHDAGGVSARDERPDEGGIVSRMMRNWRPRHLLASWAAYWVALAGVTLGPAVVAIVGATSDAQKHSSVSAGFGNDGIYLTVTRAGATVWNGAVSLSALALWLAGPPLLLWLAWLLTRPTRPGIPVTTVPAIGPDSIRELNAAPLDVQSRAEARAREER
jgi:hypothetical protein